MHTWEVMPAGKGSSPKLVQRHAFTGKACSSTLQRDRVFSRKPSVILWFKPCQACRRSSAAARQYELSHLPSRHCFQHGAYLPKQHLVSMFPSSEVTCFALSKAHVHACPKPEYDWHVLAEPSWILLWYLLSLFLSRTLRHGQSKANVAGLIVSDMVSLHSCAAHDHG